MSHIPLAGRNTLSQNVFAIMALLLLAGCSHTYQIQGDVVSTDGEAVQECLIALVTESNKTELQSNRKSVDGGHSFTG